MKRLVGGLQSYAWGSTTLLADLRGDQATDQPEAELWYGAHPASATLCNDGSSLLDHIEANPVEYLGQVVVDRFGAKLPFLLKLLAAGSPLSIQAHPSIEQARAGFMAEEAAGVARDAFHRSFRDDNHKPELISAITPFEALVGFRPVEQTLAFFDDVGWHFVQSFLTNGGPKHVVEGLLAPKTWDVTEADIADLIDELVTGCANYSGAEWEAEAELITRLAKKYPRDPGIGVAALLNFVTLKPGEALYLGAGNMHAYIGGLAVEIMANSDNVLRGGLTPKHVDVTNLLDVVLADTFQPNLVEVDSDGVYETPAPEFELRLLNSDEPNEVTGPSIVLCTEGSALVTAGSDTLILKSTEACWLGANENAVVSTNLGAAWLASVGNVGTMGAG